MVSAVLLVGSFVTPSLRGLVALLQGVVREFWLRTILGAGMDIVVPRKTVSVLVLVSLLGLVWLWRRRRSWAVLMIGPALAVGAASMLNRWPLVTRLLLFAIPSVILLTASGIDALARFLPVKLRRATVLLLSALLLTPATIDGVRLSLHPPRWEDAPAAIASLERQREPNAVIYVAAHAWPACAFYTGLDEHPAVCHFAGAHVLRGVWLPRLLGPGETPETSRASWGDVEATRILEATKSDGRVWLVFTGGRWWSNRLVPELKRKGARLERVERWKGAELYRFLALNTPRGEARLVESLRESAGRPGSRRRREYGLAMSESPHAHAAWATAPLRSGLPEMGAPTLSVAVAACNPGPVIGDCLEALGSQMPPGGAAIAGILLNNVANAVAMALARLIGQIVVTITPSLMTLQFISPKWRRKWMRGWEFP